MTQLGIAAEGGTLNEIKKVQTATGSKDFFVNHWISQVLPNSKRLKEAQKSAEEIMQEVCNWLEEQPGDKFNPLLDVLGMLFPPYSSFEALKEIEGLDPAQDTPIEVLHTILLGIAKYGWSSFHRSESMKHKDKVETFLARLSSVYRDDLNADDVDPRYVWQYRNNLIGRHFRFICQRAPLQMYNILDHADRPLYQLMLVIGRLAAIFGTLSSEICRSIW